MDLTDLNTIKSILQRHGLKPRKGYGQNFLIDPEVLAAIIDVADLKKDDTVIEVGPGIGVLTVELAKRSGRVVAVEADKNMINVLRETLREVKNVEVVEEDILKLQIQNASLAGIPPRRDGCYGNHKPQINSNIQYAISLPAQAGNIHNYKVVANLPYNITSAVLRKFLTADNSPSEMVLMVQKEVAERICALPTVASQGGAKAGEPGIARPLRGGAKAGRSGQMSLLSLSVQFYGEPEIVRLVKRTSFYPAPEVDSAVVRIRVRNPLYISPLKRGRKEDPQPPLYLPLKKGEKDEKAFWQLARIGFSARRKTLVNNLAGGFQVKKKEAEDWLKKTGLGITCRAQELSIDDWLKLLKNKPKNIKNKGNSSRKLEENN